MAWTETGKGPGRHGREYVTPANVRIQAHGRRVYDCTVPIWNGRAPILVRVVTGTEQSAWKAYVETGHGLGERVAVYVALQAKAAVLWLMAVA